ncbi:MAG: AI-2E family transporter [Eubacterium sp.]|nr:AI-2E family transporter [Eubacterium sp.]MCM1218604.1 AI-2E family transporter [Lachnospiraceae bacterium]MCM1303872.1 AI-2E family transporter [Butyrivibrio sp.]MCM1343605.1 AI-2E family transporter [Muribaculaceae bacterium]MCM1241180.1 AI-2E family transporter [Lachnospiraceae bacterium]
MGFDKEKIKQIRWLMVLAAVLVLGIIYSDRVFAGFGFVLQIARPFLYGGVIAFVLNLPMKAFENKMLKKWNGKAAKLKRPLCMILSIVAVLLVIAVVIGTVVPQVTSTAAEVGKKIPAFVDGVTKRLEDLAADHPELAEKVAELETLEINWDSLVDTVIDFLKNGAGDMLTSTVSVASGIIGGVVNLVIAFIFALYILAQKEKLGDQCVRIISAYLPERVGNKILEICSMLHRNFSNFITGQCLEAVILGTLFVIFMTIFRMPYALMIGVLIAFTALIPIVGAFIGCAVGAFLILIDDPLLALWFVVMFLVLQQIEGNLIYPRVVGSSVGLPSIWVLMAVSLGGSLFGVAGMLFFIPLLSTVYALIREGVNRRNAEKGKHFPSVSPESAKTDGTSGGAGGSGQRGKRQKVNTGGRSRRK